METIRFDCPACGMHLKCAASGIVLRGPCPGCAERIVGPDPVTGAPARLLHPPEDRKPEAHPEPAPPIPDPAPEPIPASAPADRPQLRPKPDNPQLRWLAVALTVCIFCGFIAFAWGFVTGKSANPEAAAFAAPAIRSDPPPQAERSKPLPSPPTRAVSAKPPPASTIVAKAPVEPPLPTGQPVLGPEATLKAFLDAADPGSRAEYVLTPDKVRGELDRWTEEHGPGAIAVTDVSLREAHEHHYIFSVRTPAIPGGFPAAVIRSDQGWRVNWATFVEFHDDLFRRFVEEKPKASRTFHLIAKPVAGEDGYFSRYRLTPPMPDRDETAFVRKGSIPHARLSRIFDNEIDFPPELHDELMTGDGIPLVLLVSSKTVADGRSYLEIEDVISIGWGAEAG